LVGKKAKITARRKHAVYWKRPNAKKLKGRHSALKCE
jgi:hypothetical protein